MEIENVSFENQTAKTKVETSGASSSSSEVKPEPLKTKELQLRPEDLNRVIQSTPKELQLRPEDLNWVALSEKGITKKTPE